MKANSSDWYKKGWSLDIKQQSWTENTKEQVDFIIDALELTGKKRILDLACGYGRHSLEFARRGYSVTGVDITEVYIEDAIKTAREERLDADFICDDIKNLNFREEFDVVLNMGDGAIGYLENDKENLKVFDIITRSLKTGGKSFVDIQSGDYADAHFPQQLWDAGENGLTLSVFEWNPESRIMLYGQNDFAYGETLSKPDMPCGNPTRLYTQKEMEVIMENRGMKVKSSYCDYKGTPASEKGFQLIVCSYKQP